VFSFPLFDGGVEDGDDEHGDDFNGHAAEDGDGHRAHDVGLKSSIEGEVLPRDKKKAPRFPGAPFQQTNRLLFSACAGFAFATVARFTRTRFARAAAFAFFLRLRGQRCAHQGYGDQQCYQNCFHYFSPV